MDDRLHVPYLKPQITGFDMFQKWRGVQGL